MFLNIPIIEVPEAPKLKAKAEPAKKGMSIPLFMCIFFIVLIISRIKLVHIVR